MQKYGSLHLYIFPHGEVVTIEMYSPLLSKNYKLMMKDLGEFLTGLLYIIEHHAEIDKLFADHYKPFHDRWVKHEYGDAT